MQSTDTMIEILKGIREEARITNARIDETNARLDALRDSTDGRFDRLERREAETAVRLVAELTAIARAVRELSDVLRSKPAGPVSAEAPPSCGAVHGAFGDRDRPTVTA